VVLSASANCIKSLSGPRKKWRAGTEEFVQAMHEITAGSFSKNEIRGPPLEMERKSGSSNWKNSK
jgi:hypothetical protein